MDQGNLWAHGVKREPEARRVKLVISESGEVISTSMIADKQGQKMILQEVRLNFWKGGGFSVAGHYAP